MSCHKSHAFNRCYYHLSDTPRLKTFKLHCRFLSLWLKYSFILVSINSFYVEERRAKFFLLNWYCFAVPYQRFLLSQYIDKYVRDHMKAHLVSMHHTCIPLLLFCWMIDWMSTKNEKHFYVPVSILQLATRSGFREKRSIFFLIYLYSTHT